MSINIYGILCKTTWKVYYGSTIKTIEQRLKKHEIDYRAYLKETGNYITSMEIIKNNNYEIRLLEICDVENKNQREAFYIRTFPCVNKVIPDRCSQEYKKEWCENNKEKITAKKKEQYETNKKEILKKQKQYHKKNKEQISKNRKELYQKNKEKILTSEYYKKNQIRAKKKYTCECGEELQIGNKSKHEKRTKHQNYLKNLKNTLK